MELREVRELVGPLALGAVFIRSTTVSRAIRVSWGISTIRSLAGRGRAPAEWRRL
ncbi:hypothetical protein STANM309S_03728 [Streptomyces tanashiensis]